MLSSSRPPRLRALFTTLVVTLGLIGFTAPAAQAAPGQTHEWDGGGTTANWTEAANWENDIAPTGQEILVFPAGADQLASVNDFAAGTQFHSVRINAPGYVLSGNAFTVLDSVGGFHLGASTIRVPVQLGIGVVNVAQGGTLTLEGRVTGTRGLTKGGGGLLVLSADNTHTGTTYVNAGTLAIANRAGLGAFSSGNGTEVSDGATLELRGINDTPEPIRLVGAGVGGAGALKAGSGNNLVQSVTMTGNATINTAAGTLLLIRSLAESGATSRLTKTGAGRLNVLGAASHTGGTTVAAGMLATEGTFPGALTVASGGTWAGTGGTLGDVTSVGGTVNAGFLTTPFTSVAQTLTLDPDSTFYAQLNGTDADSSTTRYSRLDVRNDVVLGDATLDLALGGGYEPAPGDTLTILTSAGAPGLTGTFKGLPDDAIVLVFGRPFRINYTHRAVTLTSVPLTASTTTVATTPSPSKPGDEVTLTATVTPSTATGTVRFYDTDGTTVIGTAAVSDGIAVTTASVLAEGMHIILARYSDGGTVASSKSAGTTHIVDGAAPDTTMTSGPVADSTGNPTTATFEFDSPANDVASYGCSLDGAAFTTCASPQVFTGLTGGSHTFAVRAIDTAGNVDATPATRTWTVAGVFTVTGDVTVGGVAKVGQILTAVSDVVTAPAATSVTGQWFRDQSAITGATGATYTLTNADVPAKLTYRQTHTRADYDTRVITSDPTVTITGGVITHEVPTVSGAAVVGEVLTATPGAADPSTATLTLTWNVDGVSTGVTGTTYTVAPGDLGKKVSVTATATQTDYDTTFKTSVATDSVAAGVFTTGPTASISGVFKVGEVLDANEGTTVPAAAAYTYQWFAGDTAITSATDRTLTLSKDYKGQQISVAVTAAHAGYSPAADTSDRSVAVVTNLAPDLNLARSTDVRLGQSATLTWNSGDATSVTASGAWTGAKSASGSEKVTPAASGTQTYTLTATNGSGTTTAQVVVNVALPAKKLTPKARDTVKSGRKITIKATGLAPGEAYTVRIGGVKVGTGKASASGKVKRAVRVPAAVKTGKRLVRVTGSLGDRTGTRHVKVAKRISRR